MQYTVLVYLDSYPLYRKSNPYFTFVYKHFGVNSYENVPMVPQKL